MGLLDSTGQIVALKPNESLERGPVPNRVHMTRLNNPPRSPVIIPRIYASSVEPRNHLEGPE